MQLLHCLLFEAQGGDNRLVDGFHAVERLRETHPASFDLMTSTAETFRQIEEGADLSIEAPMIRLDNDGRIAVARSGHLTDGQTARDARAIRLIPSLDDNDS